MNNGHSTSTRQGDALSAYLFILALEILFIQIRNNREIHETEIDDVTIKLSAYADDTYFFTLDSQTDDVPTLSCRQYNDFSKVGWPAQVKKCSCSCTLKTTTSSLS